MKKIVYILILLALNGFGVVYSMDEYNVDSSVEKINQINKDIIPEKTNWKSYNYKHAHSSKPITFFGEQVFSGGFSGLRSDDLNQDYRVLPGDQIVLRMWGNVNIERVLPVDAKGNIFIPTIGPVYVQGIPYSKLNNKIESAIKKIYTDGVNVYTQLKGVQPISVFVTGFVNSPGRYAGTATDTMIYFLNQANGIDIKNGSFRHIKLLRRNKVIAKLDIYKFLTKGYIPHIRLQDGDTIMVEQKGPVVKVFDIEKKPLMYELENNRKKGLALLNYLVLNAGVSHVLLKGYNQKIPFQKYLSLDKFRYQKIKDGDVIYFVKDIPSQTIIVHVKGSHLGMSNYVVPKTMKLIDLLANIPVEKELTAAQNLYIERKSIALQQKKSLEASLKRLQQTYLTAASSTVDEAKIRSEEAKLIREFVQQSRDVKPNGKLVVSNDHNISNIYLQEDDTIVLPAKSDSVLVSGQVMIPTSLVYKSNLSLIDYVNKAGGFSDQANPDNIIIIRQSGVVVTGNDVEIKRGDEILVLPKVPTKNVQLAKSITQIMYQLAISASVVSRF